MVLGVPEQIESFSHWNFCRARTVAGPSVVVSDPFDPGPDGAMVNPFWFKSLWRVRTSSPVEPRERVRLSETVVTGSGAASFFWGTVGVRVPVLVGMVLVLVGVKAITAGSEYAPLEERVKTE